MKPREKLQMYGPRELSDKELIDIILSHGTKKEAVFEISERLVDNFDYHELIHSSDVVELSKNLEIGVVQTGKLISALELGRRIYQNHKPLKIVRTPQDAYEILKNMQYHQKEFTRGLYLNSRHQVIHDEIISIGSVDTNIVHPREILRPAIVYGATAYIIAHNHPSGDPTPSNEDITMTYKLKNMSKELQIPLLDHLIIGENTYRSVNSELRHNKINKTNMK